MTETPLTYGHQADSDGALARVFEAGGCRTQAELAELLNVRQSTISDAKRRRCVPPHWLVKLLRLRGVNPDWILHRNGPKFLAPSEAEQGSGALAADFSGDFPLVRAVDGVIVRKVLSCFPTRDLMAELLRRKSLPDAEA